MALPSTADAAMASPDLPRKLGLPEATSVVVGTMIGAGIFLVPSSIARDLPSTGMILASWLFTGAVSLCGALAYAELGAMMPHSGGKYVYLREAYGPLAAFVCGWTLLLVIQSGAMATVAVAFAIYLSYLIPFIPAVSIWAPVALIGTLTLVNYRGVKGGALVQMVFTLLKVAGLALLIASGFVGETPSALEWSSPPGAITLPNLGLAMLGCFVAYDGWHYVAFIAGEVRDPSRNLPRSLAVGVGVVVAMYLLANVAYMRTSPLADLAAAEHVAALTAERTMGPLGATIVTVTILLSITGAANGSMLASPRIYFAQARDRLLFQKLAEIHPRFETPSFAILLHGVWTSVLALSGTYETLFSYVLYASWVFHAMTVLGVVILRVKYPYLARPYRMWGYPVTPLLFVVFALWFVVNTLIERPGPSLMGTVIMASGIPVYGIWRKKAAREDSRAGLTP